MSPRWSALVPLPDLPPEPAPYSNSPVTLVALTLVCLAMVAFAVVVLRFIWSSGNEKQMPWRAIAWTLGVAFVSVTVAALLMTSGQRQATQAHLAYSGQEVDAWHRVAAALEDSYGVRFNSSVPLIPTEDGEFMKNELTLPDASVADCFVGAEDGYYSVLCGGATATAATSVAIHPVAP